MESDGDDLENIFEDYENSENVDGAENIENKTANETPGAVKIAAPKRIVRNPRLKFNAERLCGERGIPVLVDHFKNVKFKGQGHEKEDLDKLLSKLEHWTHRLFPSMKFEDCLTHIERLGKKRPVQTCLRKIRLDMPILSSDFVKDNDDDDVKRNEDPEPEEIDAFDRLLGEGQEMSNIASPVSENVSNTDSFYSSPMLNDSSAHILGSSFGSSLTEEQKERMERNKMLAAERRKARLAAVDQNGVKLPSVSHGEIVTNNVLNEQNSFDKLLDSTECSENNAVKNSDLEASHDIDKKNSKESSNLDNDHSEELGLDDLMNLVDEEEPVTEENADDILSSPKKSDNPLKENFTMESSFDLICAASMKNKNKDDKISAFSCDDAEKFQTFHSSAENTENIIPSDPKNFQKFPEEISNVKSPLDLICEVSANSEVITDTDDSMKDAAICDENMIMKNADVVSMDCEDGNP